MNGLAVTGGGGERFIQRREGAADSNSVVPA
jgi:hypothetical protein